MVLFEDTRQNSTSQNSWVKIAKSSNYTQLFLSQGTNSFVSEFIAFYVFFLSLLRITKVKPFNILYEISEGLLTTYV